jgi:hypothetical protein
MWSSASTTEIVLRLHFLAPPVAHESHTNILEHVLIRQHDLEHYSVVLTADCSHAGVRHELYV